MDDMVSSDRRKWLALALLSVVQFMVVLDIALGVWGAVGGFGAAAGVLLGGILTDALSWQWIFFVNIPVGVTAFILAPILLKESRDATVKAFDVPGAVLVTGGLSSLVYAITKAGQDGWLAGPTLGFFAASFVVLAGFVRWVLRHPGAS